VSIGHNIHIVARLEIAANIFGCRVRKSSHCGALSAGHTAAADLQNAEQRRLVHPFNEAVEQVGFLTPIPAGLDCKFVGLKPGTQLV
jgi:hypothetical protein